jgi:toxin YoeB
MEVIYSEQAQEDIAYWKQSGNRAIMKRIGVLMADIEKHPFSGIGKPEPLKYDFSGLWSRRINTEHRIVYTVSGTDIHVLALRYHYGRR